MERYVQIHTQKKLQEGKYLENGRTMINMAYGRKYKFQIMIYLLCMLAGCKLLQGRYRLLAVVGGLLCVLLLAMVGWKSLYALIMLAGLWLFLPKRKTPENGITT